MGKEVRQMGASYIALLRKEKGSDYGVEFPDFPGCVSAGRTLEEARRAAHEALELHLEGMAAEGQAIAEPSSLDAIFESDWDAGRAVPFLVTPKGSETRVVRVNVTFKPTVLRSLDAYASEHHLTRAAALERAVHAATHREVVPDTRAAAGKLPRRPGSAKGSHKKPERARRGRGRG
jgi:predicted RNase H-like HicB family nuclease